MGIKKIKTETSKTIVTVKPDELKPGNLWQMYNDGAKAINLIKDDRIGRIWSSLNISETKDGSNPYWENSILSFSKNHMKSHMDIGDMIRFFPGQWGHFARKITIYYDSKSKNIKIFPEFLLADDQQQKLPRDIFEDAWELAISIFKSSLPAHYNIEKYAVTLQILKYPDSLTDFNYVFDLLNDSGQNGFWTNFGQKLDAYRNRILADSPFDKSIISKIYRYGTIFPGINLIFLFLNKIFFKKYAVPADINILGPPHIDINRAFTMLAGDRDSIRTELFDGKTWHEMPLTPNSLFMFPGQLLSSEIDLDPTFHRYTIKKDVSESNTATKPNVTLLLGIIDNKQIGN